MILICYVCYAVFVSVMTTPHRLGVVVTCFPLLKPHLQTCSITLTRNDTFLRLTWDGNMRITRCQNCCMRWLFFIDGIGCTDPGPVDALIFQSANYHILGPGYFSGICQRAGKRPLGAGYHIAQLRVQDCPGFSGYVYDAYTGFNSVSRILLEEVLPCEWVEGAMW